MKVVCFDLDDTLHKEIDYLDAAYRLIAQNLWNSNWFEFYQKMLRDYSNGLDVFSEICSLRPDVEKSDLLSMYRYDVHNLTISPNVNEVLFRLKSNGYQLGLITDGRHITQWNKIRALGLDQYIDVDDIVVSEDFGTEKPCVANFEYFVKRYPICTKFVYVGDNPKKDFIAPNQLGWVSVCLLDDGRNIHEQQFESAQKEYLPQIKMEKIDDLLTILDV